MDKSFFTFDIDDEIVSQNKIEKNNIEKQMYSQKNDNDFLIFASRKFKSNKSNGFVCENSVTTKKSTHSFTMVDDYVNFDFRANREIKTETQVCCNKFLDNAEVQRVIQKTQIGVIFF